jgi:antitoxin component YwqK of YwqJK toxin-antitoxin module
MKTLLLTLTLLFSSIFSFAQDSNLRKTEIKGDLLEVTLYYENGTIMQHGFYTEDGKLHASWESYYIDGTRKCVATYNYGVKVGIWTYWNNDKITKVEYDNNKIISVKEVSEDSTIKKDF